MDDRSTPVGPDGGWGTHVVRALGTLTLGRHGIGSGTSLSPGQRQMLAALVAGGPAGTSAGTLAESLWSGEPPMRWESSLRMRLSRLRRAAEPGTIPPRGYRLDLDPTEVDVWHLLELSSTPERIPDGAELAWALAGEPFPGVEITGHLHAAVLEACRAQRQLAVRFCEAGPATVHDHICGRLEWLVHRDPIDADLASTVGICLMGAGRRSDAVWLLRRFVRAHTEEIGIPPPFPVLDLLEELAGRRIVSDTG